MAVRFFGFPNEEISISDGEVSAALTPSAPAALAEDAVFLVGKATAGYGGKIGANIATAPGIINALDNRPGMPTSYRNLIPASAGTTGNRLKSVELGARNLEAEDRYTGAKLRVWRLDDGVFSLLRESTITKHANSGWFQVSPAAGTPPGTSLVVSYGANAAIGASQWFAVAAIDGSGNRGALGVGNTSFTTTSTPFSGTAVAGLFPQGTGHMPTFGVAALAAPTVTVTPLADSENGATISWTTVSGAAGYLVYVSDHAPEDHLGAYLDCETGPAMLPGDMALIELYDTAPTQSAYQVWTRLVKNDITANPFRLTDPQGESWTFVDTEGQFAEALPYAPQFTVTSEKRAQIYLSGVGQPGDLLLFVPELNKHYACSFWLKANSSLTAATIVSGFSSSWIEVVSVNGVAVEGATSVVEIPATTTWTKYTIIWKVVTQSGAASGGLNLNLTEPGVYTVSQSRFWDPTHDFETLGGINRTRLEAANLEHIRLHGTVKTNPKSYDLYTLLFGRHSNLHALLGAVADLGCNVWIQPEFHLTDAEILGLVEYLFAETGTGRTWANLRAAKGRTAPWGDAFTRIYWEWSNETWLFGPTFYAMKTMTDQTTSEVLGNDAVWGLMDNRLRSVVRSSPYWTSAQDAQVEWQIGGRFNTNYGDVAATYSPGAQRVNRAPYPSGWENSGGDAWDGSTLNFRDSLLWPATETARRLADNDTWIAEAIAGGANPALNAGTYEDYPGHNFTPPNIPGIELMGSTSKAVGVFFFDKVLRQSRHGYSLQSFFTASPTVSWGAYQVTGLGTATYPTFQWMQLWNNSCAGTMRTVTDIRTPKRDATVKDVAYTDIPEVACYASKTATGYAVAVFNRNLPYDALDTEDDFYDAGDDGARTVRVRLPIPTATNVTRHQMNGAYNEHNLYPPGGHTTNAYLGGAAWGSLPSWTPDTTLATVLSISATDLGVLSGGDLVLNIPAAEAFVYIVTV